MGIQPHPFFNIWREQLSTLVTLNEIKNYLKIKLDNDSEDDRLVSINTYVSSFIESYCGRRFSANTYTEHFDGGKASVFIDNPPIIGVHEVAHFLGDKYEVLGGPGSKGQQIETEGSSHRLHAFGDAKTTTRIKKFGTSSLQLDGTSSYLLVPYSEDFDFGGEPFTVETYIRPRSLANSSIVSKAIDSENYWELGYSESAGLYFEAKSANVTTIYAQAATLVPNTFSHVALVRGDTNYAIYINGTLSGNADTTSNSVPSLNTDMLIGAGPSGFFNGYLDEVRISWIDRYTTNFSALTVPLSSDEDTKLLLHLNEGRNKTEILDFSRRVNEFIWYEHSGEVTFDTKRGSGTPGLGFFSPRVSQNYTSGVRVMYTGGYEAVPNDVKMASLDMIKIIYKGKEGVKSMRLGGDDSTSHELSSDGLPPQVRRILNLYRLTS